MPSGCTPEPPVRRAENDAMQVAHLRAVRSVNSAERSLPL